MSPVFVNSMLLLFPSAETELNHGDKVNLSQQYVKDCCKVELKNVAKKKRILGNNCSN